MSEYQIVDEVTEKSMDGATELEKKVNAYLTAQFISHSNVPSDECLTEAKVIIKMVLESL